MKQDELEITIYNENSEIVIHEIVKAQTASQKEIDEMVSMIEGGCPAYLAASMIIAERKSK